MKDEELKNKIVNIIKKQGFKINPHVRPREQSKDSYRNIQQRSKLEQINLHKSFLRKNIKKIEKFTRNGSEIKPEEISLELREVQSEKLEDVLFRWWNLVWWSVPYQRAYGRQMRFIIWDKTHDAPFGLIGLQSPILRMSVRDKALEIPTSKLDIWINKSMQAQRLGALPPYNELLGGKMTALAVASNEVREHYSTKYKDKVSIIKNRIIEPELLFVTTTSAFGKSSIYNRLKYKSDYIAQRLGYTKGSGSFHIPENLYLEIIAFLKEKGVNVSRSFGYGPSRRIKLLYMAFKYLGLPDFEYHNIKREFYLFPMAKNLKQVIKSNEKPEFYDRPFVELFTFWKNRWCLPRAERDKKWQSFNAKDYLNKAIDLYGLR